MVDSNENINRGQSVAGVVIVDNKVLLARHTYGSGNGKLIIPGGYVNIGETPQDAVVREFTEETGVKIKPLEILGIRFNMHDWYVVFSAEYIEGTACSDGKENSEVLWLDVHEVLLRDDVPELTKIFVERAVNGNAALRYTQYSGNAKHAPYSVYC